jgi:hypothetical protein
MGYDEIISTSIVLLPAGSVLRVLYLLSLFVFNLI